MTKYIPISFLTVLMLIIPSRFTTIYSQSEIQSTYDDLGITGLNQLDDTSSISYQLDSSMWVFQLGYFPNYSQVASSGYIFSLQYEKQSNRLFDRGWYLIVKQTFTTKGDGLKGGLSFGPYVMVERFGFNANAVLVKFGPGVFVSGLYGGLSLLFSLEYERIIDNNIAVSLTLSQESILFKYFFPLQIGASIKF